MSLTKQFSKITKKPHSKEQGLKNELTFAIHVRHLHHLLTSEQSIA
jgi:hypothetical protein